MALVVVRGTSDEKTNQAIKEVKKDISGVVAWTEKSPRIEGVNPRAKAAREKLLYLA